MLYRALQSPSWIADAYIVPRLELVTRSSGGKHSAAVLFPSRIDFERHLVFLLDAEREDVGKALEILLKLTERLVAEKWQAVTLEVRAEEVVKVEEGEYWKS